MFLNLQFVYFLYSAQLFSKTDFFFDLTSKSEFHFPGRLDKKLSFGVIKSIEFTMSLAEAIPDDLIFSKKFLFNLFRDIFCSLSASSYLFGLSWPETGLDGFIFSSFISYALHTFFILN